MSTGILIPLYIYPTDASWMAVASAKQTNPNVPFVAVINPNSGPGLTQDPNYVAGINNLRAAGIVVLGYVPTDYGATPIATVESSVNAYKSWYALDGIFFDEMSTSGLTQSYYQSLASYCNSLGYTITAGNPGATEPISLSGIFTIEVFYENLGIPSSISSRGAFISYGVPSLPSLASYANASYLYVTDANLPNPYNVLPSYFNQEVSSLAALIPPVALTTSISVSISIVPVV